MYVCEGMLERYLLVRNGFRKTGKRLTISHADIYLKLIISKHDWRKWRHSIDKKCEELRPDFIYLRVPAKIFVVQDQIQACVSGTLVSFRLQDGLIQVPIISLRCCSHHTSIVMLWHTHRN